MPSWLVTVTGNIFPPTVAPWALLPHSSMATEAAFLAAAGYAIYRDVRGYFPTSTTSTPKRLRASSTQPDAMADDTCDPAAYPSRPPSSRLSRGLARQVRACCESLGELKWIENTASGTVPAYTGAPRVTCLNDLGQGTTASTRNGNKIINKLIQLEGLVYLPANKDGDIYRLIVVVDTECFGSLCSWNQYVQGATNAVYALPSAETVGKGKRFAVLVDRLIPLTKETVTTAGGCPMYKSFSIRIPLNLPTTYSGNVGTVSDIVKNSICVIEASYLGNAVSEWQERTTFLDM